MKTPFEDFMEIARGRRERARQGWREGGRRGSAERWRRQREREAAARKLQRAERYAGYYRSKSNKDRMKLALPGWQVLAARMLPRSNAWFALPDLCEILPEYGKNSVKAYVYQKMRRHGLLERVVNPDYDASRPDRCQAEPMWLFRLSLEGEKKAAQWRERLSEG